MYDTQSTMEGLDEEATSEVDQSVAERAARMVAADEASIDGEALLPNHV